MNSQQLFNNTSHMEQIEISQDSIIASTRADIILGMPKKACQYHGICKIDPFEEIQDETVGLPANKAHATVCKTDNGDLVIQFAKERMHQRTFQRHFATKVFTVLESIAVPDFINEELDGKFWVKVGEYPIIDTPAYFQVNFLQNW